MRVHLLAVLVGAGYYTIGFLTYWLAATPYSKNLGAEAFTDGIWAELFPFWAIGQVLLTVWVCFMALGLPIARHRALSAGVGAGLLSLAGIILLGLEDVARVWLDVIGIVAGVVIGLALDRYARTRVLSYPSAWHLIWLWVPGGAFIASAFILINSVVLAFVVDVVTAEAFWLAVPLAGGIIMAVGWVQLARTQRDRDRRIGRELVGSLLILVGAVAPALITMFFFRALFLRQVVGL